MSRGSSRSLWFDSILAAYLRFCVMIWDRSTLSLGRFLMLTSGAQRRGN